MPAAAGISILIPWRTDHDHRERLWAHLEPLWRALPYELCTATDGADDGAPFSYAAAANTAARAATGDVLITYGADQLPDVAAIDHAATVAREHGWAMLFTTTGFYSPFATQQILAGANPDHLGVETVEPHCTGLMAVRHDIWNDVGGMDERFHGWGYEDAALRDELTRRYGRPETRPGMLRCLWHTTRHHTYSGPNADLYHREYAP